MISGLGRSKGFLRGQQNLTVHRKRPDDPVNVVACRALAGELCRLVVLRGQCPSRHTVLSDALLEDPCGERHFKMVSSVTGWRGVNGQKVSQSSGTSQTGSFCKLDAAPRGVLLDKPLRSAY